MAVYERYEDNGYLVTNLKEHAIYGSDRLGLDLNGVELSRLPIGEGDEEDPTGDPSGRHALVIGEILYDSPTTGDDFPTGKEYSEGEYIVLINKSGMDLDLSDYTLRLGEDSLVLSDSLSAGERVIIGFGADMPRFQRIAILPSAYSDAVQLQTTFSLSDRGGVLRVTHSGGNEVDAMPYGAFYGLNAGNPYIADSLLDSLGQRSSLTSVRRGSYGGQSSAEGSASEVEVGISDPGIEPEPSGRAVVGSYTLWRGRKVYELKNHLGNVLAVVSDVKIGVGPVNTLPSLIDYYTADVVEMSDYEPFGMLLAKRHWVSGEGYRFGFNGKEGDDEWNGDGNMYNYGFRIHDPRLGRFLSVDPLAPDYPELTTYQYASNCPIWMIDLDGLEGTVSTDMGFLFNSMNWGWNQASEDAKSGAGTISRLGMAPLKGVANAITSLPGLAQAKAYYLARQEYERTGNPEVLRACIVNSSLQSVFPALHTNPSIDKAFEIGKHVQEEDYIGAAEVYLEYLGEGATYAVLTMASGGTGSVSKSAGHKPIGTGTVLRPVIATEVEISTASSSEMVTVGRWMSKAEYEMMAQSERMVEGAGGQTFVMTGGAEGFISASKGSVYAEFQVNKNSLIQGGQTNWFKTIGPNAGSAMKAKLQKQGGEISPQIKNLTPILETK